MLVRPRFAALRPLGRLLSVLLLAAACGEPGASGPSDTPAPSGQAPAPGLITSGSPVERVIGAAGGELLLSTPAGDWRLEIPAGSFAAEQTISRASSPAKA